MWYRAAHQDGSQTTFFVLLVDPSTVLITHSIFSQYVCLSIRIKICALQNTNPAVYPNDAGCGYHSLAPGSTSNIYYSFVNATT